MTPPAGSGRPRAGAASSSLAAPTLVGLRKAATVLHAFTDTHVEVHRAGVRHGRLGGRAAGAFRDAVAACTPHDVGPAFTALGLPVGPVTLRLVGGPGTTVTRGGLLVDGRAHTFVTCLAPAVLMDVLDSQGAGLAVRFDDVTDVALISGADADAVTPAAVACAVAEVEPSLPG